MPIAGILLINLPTIMLELSMPVLLLSFPAAALPAASLEPMGSCLCLSSVGCAFYSEGIPSVPCFTKPASNPS